MAWKITRVLPAWHAAHGQPGPHMLGETAVEFDADGVATVDDGAVVALAQQFPDTFTVEEVGGSSRRSREAAEPPPEPPDETAGTERPYGQRRR
jgi:hypothetical protein